MSALEEWRTVIGVVGDVARYSLTGFPQWVDGLQYVPLAQNLPVVGRNIQLTMLVQSMAPEATMLTLQAAIQHRFSDVVVSRVAPLEGIRSESIVDQRSSAWLLALVAALGLALGIIGVHGFISHRAAQRTREIGIRIAMGATTGAVVRMVIREALLVSLAGCIIGVAVAFGLSRFLQSLLFGITQHDTAAFAVFPAILFTAALLAAAILGWRAAQTDPAVTLRQEH